MRPSQSFILSDPDSKEGVRIVSFWNYVVPAELTGTCTAILHWKM